MFEKIIRMIEECGAELGKVKESIRSNFKEYQVYPDSIYYREGLYFFLALVDSSKKLVIYDKGIDKGRHFDRFSGLVSKCETGNIKVCELSNENNRLIGEIFPFARPSSHKGRNITIGLGDRLGIASAGHIRELKGKDVFPVLAQQSIRELNLTGRNYNDVLSAASWAVFQEGYTTGFGADGDHLKTADEVKMAIDCGFTMITLDCSEHIDNTVPALGIKEIETRYQVIPFADRKQLEEKYLGKVFEIGNGMQIKFNDEEFKKIVLIYLKAIRYTIDIYNNIIKKCGRDMDFEMSIDETLTPTTPASHYFVANELIAGGVDITSLAPRFCGEFQKGIDYIGDIAQFTAEFELHAAIARKLGYKISVHSGSDKFSIFPVVGEITGGNYHLKTAGTNWLEAVRVIAEVDPALYRRLHGFALENLEAARKYYHISAEPSNIQDINKIRDSELPMFLEQNDSRQVLHITYGLILTAKNDDGTYKFRNEIYTLLNKYEEKYYQVLQRHLNRHLGTLGIKS